MLSAYFPFASLSFLLVEMRSILAGARAATLDLEVKLRVETIHSEATDGRSSSPWRLPGGEAPKGSGWAAYGHQW